MYFRVIDAQTKGEHGGTGLVPLWDATLNLEKIIKSTVFIIYRRNTCKIL